MSRACKLGKWTTVPSRLSYDKRLICNLLQVTARLVIVLICLGYRSVGTGSRQVVKCFRFGYLLANSLIVMSGLFTVNFSRCSNSDAKLTTLSVQWHNLEAFPSRSSKSVTFGKKWSLNLKTSVDKFPLSHCKHKNKMFQVFSHCWQNELDQTANFLLQNRFTVHNQGKVTNMWQHLKGVLF